MRKKGLSPGLLLVLVLLLGCNEPPLYESHAEEILQAEGIASAIIDKLTEREALTEAEVDQLAEIDAVAVLHLVGANPGTPVERLEQLARHEHEEVVSGVASNPSAPPALLVSLRRSRYHFINGALASNPSFPLDALRELFEDEAAGWTSFSYNPNLPADLQLIIAREGSQQDLYYLALNENLVAEAIPVLKDRGDKLVQRNLDLRVEWYGE